MTYSPSIRWTVGKNTIAQIIGKTIGAGITLLISILIARKFGATGYGDFTKIITYVAFFYLIADFGLNAVFLQLDHDHTDKNLWHTLIVLRLVLSICLMLVALLILALLPQGTTQGYTPLVKLGILLFSPTIFFQAILTSSNAIFQKHLRYDLSTIATISGSLVSLFLIFLVTQSGQSIIGSIGALGAGSMITGIVALFLAIKLQKSLHFSLHTHHMTTLLVAATPLAATLLFNLVYFRIDSILLTLTRSTQEVGIYGFAYKIFEFPLVIPTFFMNSLYPLLLERKNFLHLLKRSSIILFFSSLALLVIFWISAPLVSLVKEEFQLSVGALRILILGLPFFFLSSLTMWGLIALKKQRVLVVIYGTAMMANIFLNVWLIPMYGYRAAAWITVVSEGLVLVLSTLTLVKYITV